MTARDPDAERKWRELGAALEEENFYGRADATPQPVRSLRPASTQGTLVDARLNRIKRTQRVRYRR